MSRENLLGRRPGILLGVGLGLIGLLVALYLVLRHFGQDPGGLTTLVGKIDSVQGTVTARLARTLEFKPVLGSQPLFSQEVLQTDQGEAILTLQTQTQIKVTEATKFVVETDATRADALIGTILEGKVIILNPGVEGRFRLIQQGREMPLDRAIVNQPNVVSAIKPAPISGLVITATTPNENEEPLPESSGSSAVPSRATPDPTVASDVLTNEDIVRQLRGQTGFFQRCYLGYINRVRGDKASVEGGFSAQTPVAGTIGVSFKVQSNGRVNDAKITRSEFKDEILHRCVIEVVERARFKPFAGDAVPVLEFPIRLQ
jgi:TonB family protein